EDVEIARRAAVEARFAFALHAQARAVVDAGRHLDRDRLRLLHASCAVAGRAWILDHFSCTAALRAGALHSEKAALREAELPSAAAAAARHRLRSRLGAAALARGAGRDARNLQRHFPAADRLLEFEREVEAQVIAAHWTRGAATPGAEEIAE